MTIRGIRDPIPGNTVIGRLGNSLGAPSPIAVADLMNTTEVTNAITGKIPQSANPSATAGPAAVDGTAKTFMTSDSAPAVQTATTSQLGLVQPDGTTITISAGVISATGGTVSNTWSIPTSTDGWTNSGQAYATQGNIFKALDSFTIDTIVASFPSGSTSGHVYEASVCVVNSSFVIQSVSANVSVTSSGGSDLVFSLGSDVTITAGTIYVIAITDTSAATTTTSCGVGGAAAAATVQPTYPNLPITPSYTSTTVTRMGLATKTIPLTGTFTSLGGVALIGLRAQGI